jgi:hypothetical protein
MLISVPKSGCALVAVNTILFRSRSILIRPIGTSIIIDNYVDRNEVPARVVSCADMHLLPDDETETEDSNDQSIGSRGRRMSRGDSAAQPPAKKVKSRYGVGVPWWIAMMEYVPLYGRMVSHFPGE